MRLASASSKSDGQSTSKQDSKSGFWPLLGTPCLDRDGGQSTFSTSNRRSLFPSLTCSVMCSCASKCMSSLVLSTCLLLLRFLCRLPGRWILFILIGAWNGMLENGILPRKHAYLKLRDDPGNGRSRHSPLGEDTLITQIEGPTMHCQLFILLLVILVKSNH